MNGGVGAHLGKCFNAHADGGGGLDHGGLFGLELQTCQMKMEAAGAASAFKRG